MKTLLAFALCLVPAWGKPVQREIEFDVQPGYATVLIPNDKEGWDEYPVGRPTIVRLPANQFDLEVRAAGWKPITVPCLANQFSEKVWPATGTLRLQPASARAWLEQAPRWPLLGLLLIPLVARLRQRPVPLPAELPSEHSLPWELEPGTSVDKYVVMEKLGEGAAGIVYRVSGDLALKLLKPHAGTVQSLPRFRREMKALCRLRHPNIPFLADFGEYHGMSYLVMELLAPTTLADELPLPPAEATSVLKQLAEALAFCHKQGILHRDIKPENVVRSEGGRVKLTDFGLAREHDSTTLTQEGAKLGTPNYMAPEIIQGEPATLRSDQYSLGCLAYHMLSGRPPYQAESALAVMMQHLGGAAEPLENVPEPLLSVVTRMMQVEPSARFADMDAVVHSLGT